MLGYKTKEEMATDAYDIINQMMGELHAARTIYFFASDKFLNSPKLRGLREKLKETTLVYMRRAALSVLSSVMFRFKELYEDFLGELNCRTNEAKAFLKSMSREKLEELRHANEHLIDKATGRYQSIEKIDDIFSALNQNDPDLFEKKRQKRGQANKSPRPLAWGESA